jgi:hypothetical protein
VLALRVLVQSVEPPIVEREEADSVLVVIEEPTAVE